MTQALIQNVCVYCGASDRVSERYIESARQVGQVLAENRLGLVYGGGRMGLMGAVADSVLEHGGSAIGIIPKHLQDREVYHETLNELHIVDTMHVRKQMMIDRSDAFLILPGGYGTLEEAFEILTWKQIGLHGKPIVFLNVYDFWTPLRELKRHLHQEDFIRDRDLKLFAIVDTIEAILPALETQLRAATHQEAEALDTRIL